MNLEKLKKAEMAFLALYPEGFESEEMQEIAKKHKMSNIIEFSHKHLGPDDFDDKDEAAENLIRVVSRSSMVSLFEKPKFRDGVRTMSRDDRWQLVDGVHKLLHGDEADGFHEVLDVLRRHKLAKWTLMTVFRCYYYAETDFLYKPTTVKGVIKQYELEGLVYKPQPSYEFFVKYRQTLQTMKKHVDPRLSPNMAAFSGFLMMIRQG
jgi:hypothetical protein